MSEARSSRYDQNGDWLWYGVVKNYVVARRKGATPRLFTRREWDGMSRSPIDHIPSGDTQ